VDLGVQGVDNTFGSGRADAQASGNSVCAPPTPSPTPAPTASPNAFGNVDCTGNINSIDALKVLRNNAALSVTQIGPEPDACTNIGTGPVTGGGLQGDVDCSGAVNAIDALKLLRFAAGLSVAQTQPCPLIGS
jgi:hypothetical protein